MGVLRDPPAVPRDGGLRVRVSRAPGPRGLRRVRGPWRSAVGVLAQRGLDDGREPVLGQSIRCVHHARIGSGEGLLDFEPDMADIRPDYFVVNVDGSSLAKRKLCERNGVRYVELPRTPKPGLPARSSTAIKADLETPAPALPQSPSEVERHWKLLSSKYVGDYKLIRLREDCYRFESSQAETNFIVCESADWVLIVAVTTDQQLVLVRQYRHGIREVVLEIPASWTRESRPKKRLLASCARRQDMYPSVSAISLD